MMDIGSLFVILGIFLLAGLFVVRPFFDQEQAGDERVRHRYSHLIAEKERLLAAIQELDLDMDLKKISSEDHARKRAGLTAQAARVLEELDQLREEGSPDGQKAAAGGQEMDELEALISSRREELEGASKVFCPHCGERAQADDRFCTHCGKEIQ